MSNDSFLPQDLDRFSADAEHALEPVQLIRRSGLVLRVGRVLLAAGCGSYRVRTAMDQVGKAIGLERVEAQISITEITATAHQGGIFRTQVVETGGIGVNADRIAIVERFANELQPGTSVEEIEAFLDRVEAKPVLYGPKIAGLYSGLACAAFAFLNNGGLWECVLVFIAAMLGQLARRALTHRGHNHFGVWLVAGVVAATTYLGIAEILSAGGVPITINESAYVSAVLFLVPGFPLITAALDLSREDFGAGISRLAYAVMLLTCAAISVWVVSAAFGLAPNPLSPLVMPWYVLLILRTVTSLLGVFGFAILFNSPFKIALAAALIGAVANVARIELLDAGMIAQAAAGIAGVVVGVLANIIAPRMKVPRLTLCVPAVVIMVPGVTAYRAIYYLNDGQTLDAMAYGVQAVFVVLALSIGLMLARMVTDREWGMRRRRV